jgi:beta-lactamase class A
LKIFIAVGIALVAAVLTTVVLTTASSPTPADARARTATPTRIRTPAPTPTPQPRAEAARALDMIATECIGSGPFSARAVFLWGPSRGGPQWMDLSIFNNGFAPATFVGMGAFAPDRWGLVWEGLLQGITHYARVNTLTADGWKSSDTVSFYTPVCDANAYGPAPAQDMAYLRDRMAWEVAASGIDAAVAITDLRTGETVDVNGAMTRLPGCTINLFVLMRVAEDLQFGRYPEPEPGDLIGQTINRSDPITARLLMKYWVGGGDLGAGLNSVGDFISSLGMSSTLLDHPPAFPDESLYGSSNRVTALDANRGLQAIWDGRVLLPPWRDYFLQKMTLVKPGLNYHIPAGTSAGAVVSHKNGFLWEEGWADNDIGIVWYERGGERYGYAISFFTQGVATKYADIPLGQTISSLAYQWFVGRYGYP